MATEAGIGAVAGPGKAARLGRSDRSTVGRWFWEIDKLLLILVAVLISIGLIAVAAASPAAAQRYSGGGMNFAPLHYFYRQLIWIMVAVPVMIAVSMLPKPSARRLSLAGAALLLLLLFLVPVIGQEVNGAQRWLGLGFTNFQPSEFLKPLFIVSVAWLLSLQGEGSFAAGRAADRVAHRHHRAAADAAAQFRRDDHLRRRLGAAARACRVRRCVSSTCSARRASR